MEQFFYCIYDIKALQILHGLLQIFPSDASAQRFFMDMMSNPESMVNRHPNDFVLLRVGSINQDTLAVSAYGVGFTDPVITGTALVRLFSTPPTPPAPIEDDQSESMAVTA